MKRLTLFEDDHFIAFLDSHPLFFGHTLLAPKGHYETLYDLPENLVEPLFLLTRRIGKAVELGMDSSGSFIAMNNTVSQSIPHLHVHIVPRNKKDGLKGFFWPRYRYESDEQRQNVQDKISSVLERTGLSIYTK